MKDNIMKKFEELKTDDLIATFPLKERDQAKLLVIDRKTKTISHMIFRDIVNFFSEGDCLVINKTKVIKASLDVYCETGSKREILLLKPINNGFYFWLCLGKKLSIGKRYFVNENLWFRLLDRNEDGYIIEFNKEINFDVLEEIGKVPLPHYILKKRKNLIKSSFNDEDAYQTIYASEKGSIAAPTAGFHFSEHVFNLLKEKGVVIAEIVLHIGYGTFKMVRTDPDSFKMPPEYASIAKEEADKINNAKKSGKKVFVVGTSSMRAVEKLNDGSYVVSGETYSDIFIKPGWTFKIADHFITNLHLPHSPPLYMTLAFCGDEELLLKAYKEAVEKKYRFYSYGDCSLIL